MSHEYYDCEELILRDHLAIDRTVLANERTLLAYIRTTLALLAAGASFVQFFKLLWLEVIGYLLIVSGLVLVSIGFRRFLSFRHAINETKKLIQTQEKPP